MSIGPASWPRHPRAVLAPRSVVRHVHGAAAGDASPLFRFHVERNRAVTALRNADFPLAVWSGLVLAAKVVLAWARMALRRQRAAHAVAVARAFGSYLLRLPRALAERYVVRSTSHGVYPHGPVAPRG